MGPDPETAAMITSLILERPVSGELDRMTRRWCDWI
jgi:hypothetical protein